MRLRRPNIAVSTIAVLALVGCVTGGGNRSSNSADELRAQLVLTDEQQAQLASYRALEEGAVLVDELQAIPAEVYEIDPYTQSYEGYLILRLLGLFDQLSLADQYEFIVALFRDIPNPVVFGAPVRNIVVGQWYDNDEPLIVHVTLAFSGNDEITLPAIVTAFNSQEGIRQFRHQIIRATGPAVEYPRFAQTDNGTLPVFNEQYVLNVLNSGQVSASRAAGQTDLPDFATVEDVGRRVNLTDDYLRDGDPDNDALVVPVLNEVIEDRSVPALYRVHARLQLAMYHLLAGDLQAAQLVSDEILASELMELPEVSDTELAEFARIDLPNIIAIAGALEAGDPSGL